MGFGKNQAIGDRDDHRHNPDNRYPARWTGPPDPIARPADVYLSNITAFLGVKIGQTVLLGWRATGDSFRRHAAPGRAAARAY